MAAAEPTSTTTLEEQQENSSATAAATATATTAPSSAKQCCGSCSFDGLDMARGYNLLGTGRGPIVMSNIFLSTALIYLASAEVGCTEEVVEDDNTTSWQVVEECDAKVYGVFKPAALITNIAVISGVLSALLMPVIGAIVDYTPHRWTVGMVSAALIMLVQIVQIGTTEATWFVMSILQALTGFFYQMQVLATYAYLPDISRVVGQVKMTQYTSTFSMVQYACQMVFLIVIIALSMFLNWGDVLTAQVSQGINSVTVSLSFYAGWKFMPKVPARNTLPPNQSLLLQGFRQNWQTAKRIQREYKKGLRWYLLALIFAEASANSFTLVAVVFLDEELGLTTTEIGIFFLVALGAMIPGGGLGGIVTSYTNPNTSWRLSLVVLFALGVFGGLALSRDNAKTLGYAWGFLVGLDLGWFYPTENLFFSMIIPKGQEAEMSGIFVYCTQIIGWLPPLIFSILVEQNVNQGIGVIVVSAFALVAVALLSMASSWPEIVADVRKLDATTTNNNQDDEEEAAAAAAKANNSTEEEEDETVTNNLPIGADLEAIEMKA